MYRFLLSFIVTLLILIESAHSQSVGVVMSGGGAKGLYHIGVLQALEENSIPVDYVAGTSIGAIVGGFYAAGYSPQEIAQIATSGELSEWVSGRIDNNYGAYFREHNQFRKNTPILSARVDTNNPDKTLELPKGLISSTQIDMALCNYLSSANVASGGDFNRLMIPFLCIASDITDRRKVIFQRGDLGLAVRASMALPVAFKPILMDSMILYDGGISDNFPWRPMQRLQKPDFMIGVSCSSGNVDTDDDVSLLDQILLLTMNKSNYNMPKETSIMIERNVPTGTLDFSQAASIIKMGYDDTMEKMDSIKRQITTTFTPDEFATRRKEFRDRCPELIFDSYNVEGLNPDQTEYVYGYMSTKRSKNTTQQREMSFEELKTNLYSILSSDDFISEYPNVTYNEESDRYRFNINLTNKPSLKFSLGGNLSSTPFNQIYFGVDYRNIGSTAKTAYAEVYLGPVYTAGIIGGRVDLYRNAPIFFDSYLCFASKNLRHGTFGILTEATNTSEIKDNDNYLSMGLGLPILKRMMFTVRANVGREIFRFDPTEIYDAGYVVDRARLQFAAVKGEVEHITLDKPLYPTQGSKLTVSGIYLYGRESNYFEENIESARTFETIPKITHSWYGARVRYDKYITSPRSSSWFSMGLNFDGVYTNIDNFATTVVTDAVLPTYQPTLHSKMVFMPEYSAKSYAAGGLIPQFMILNNFYTQLGVYTMFRDRYEGKQGEVPFPIGERYSLQFISDLSFVYYTRFGPLSLSLSKYGLSNMDNLYMTFNFGYSIFAPKGTFY